MGGLDSGSTSGPQASLRLTCAIDILLETGLVDSTLLVFELRSSAHSTVGLHVVCEAYGAPSPKPPTSVQLRRYGVHQFMKLGFLLGWLGGSHDIWCKERQ